MGITISWLNMSLSSHTRSLEARVPRKMKIREMMVYTILAILALFSVLPKRYSTLILPNMFQPSTVEKAKKNSATAINMLPPVSPKKEPKAVWARLVLLMASGMVPSARIPPLVYRVMITVRAVIVSTTKVSINTPIMATVPCS